jgi:hypothetical protein
MNIEWFSLLNIPIRSNYGRFEDLCDRLENNCLVKEVKGIRPSAGIRIVEEQRPSNWANQAAAKWVTVDNWRSSRMAESVNETGGQVDGFRQLFLSK